MKTSKYGSPADNSQITIYSEPGYSGTSVHFSNDATCHTLPGYAPIYSVEMSGSVQACMLFYLTLSYPEAIAQFGADKIFAPLTIIPLPTFFGVVWRAG
ncbi:uncharacterized protein DSM5745_08645 [Aspergillus mulundensis]|uniref:Uncharacterized protein n=1 Tax=Aspergillus mulundensis TaxID=1810919 RepID=A0A3D8R4A4_9EURO|nr:hypothetical protein DSM5745_08645 [Aspergillus mulundensis]RDW68885.1 hypothetical protein DSM5745_08645 [Aspergillus mulundensis]